MQTIIRFFKTIFLVDLLKGMWLTLKYTPQPAFTFQYPRSAGQRRRGSGGCCACRSSPPAARRPASSATSAPRHAPTTSLPSAVTGSRA